MTPVPILSGDAIALLLSKGKPVLFCDTCALLDVIRIPFRETVQEANAVLRAAQSALALAQVGDIALVVPPPVLAEWQTHSGGIKAETEKHVLSLYDHYEVLREIGRLKGTPYPPADMLSWNIAGFLFDLSKQLTEAAIHIQQMDSLDHAALQRDASCTAPARKGKGTKDCILYEHILHVMRELRQQSFVPPLVFITSNVNDFNEGNSSPREPIASELGAVTATICKTWDWAMVDLLRVKT